MIRARRIRGAALMALSFVVLVAFVACDDDDASVPPIITVSPASSNSALGVSPRPAPPAELDYRVDRIIPDVSTDALLGFFRVPGATDEALVMSQSGRIWRVSHAGGGSPRQFADISGKLIRNPGSEEGLLGLAFSPKFASDQALYLYYTAGNPRRSILSRFRVSDGTLDRESEDVILEVPQPFANHNGGQLAFGPDGYLYVGLGDGGSAGDPHGNGQNLATLLGSILRIDVSASEGYRIPPDNPFVHIPTFRPEIYAYGLRNPWRFSFDSRSGTLWSADVGQNEWEEIDEIVAGGNYGWNIMEGPECFKPSDCDKTGFKMPRAVYGHDSGCSVTGGFVYRGASMPELDGWYVYGDYCSGKIWAFDTSSDDSSSVLLADTGRSITSFGELPGGELAVVTQRDGVYALVRRAS